MADDLTPEHFNPRSREGSDSALLISLDAIPTFQSTLPRRERLVLPASLLRTLYFNPRSREGSDTAAPKSLSTSVLFQSTLPRRERRKVDPNGPDDLTFQSTLPRRERHADLGVLSIHQGISIHAPAKGATQFLQIRQLAACISIHAPAKGATGKPGPGDNDGDISIHAPAKGATCLSCDMCSTCRGFQSTLPRRERPFVTSCIIPRI